MRKLTLDEAYRYDNYLEDIEYLKETYPELIQVYPLGQSEDGRTIYVFSIGHGAKPIIMTAGVHARETINTPVVIRIIESYLELLKNKEPVILDFDVEERILTSTSREEGQFTGSLIDETKDINIFTPEEKVAEVRSEYNIYDFFEHFTYFIIPLLNPDGYEIAIGGFDTIRNEALRNEAKKFDIPHEEWKYNARGIDLNRNFPAKSWKKKFENDIPASERETKALIDLFTMIPAAGYLDLHSRGKVIYYYKKDMPNQYNEMQYEIAKRLQIVTGYEIMDPEFEVEENDTGGNTVHYFSQKFQKPAITVETVKDLAPFPLDVRFQTPTFQEIYALPLEFALAVAEEAESNA